MCFSKFELWNQKSGATLADSETPLLEKAYFNGMSNNPKSKMAQNPITMIGVIVKSFTICNKFSFGPEDTIFHNFKRLETEKVKTKML